MASDKQELAVRIYVANRGISKAEAMRRAGYSEKTARNPKNLTNSKSWDELLDEYLPDERLVDTHSSLLNARKLDKAEFPSWLPDAEIREMILEQGGTPRNYEMNPITQMTAVWYWIPDVMAQKAALELAYKLKGKMTQKVEHSGAVDGLFGTDALTINVVDAEHNAQS